MMMFLFLRFFFMSSNLQHHHSVSYYCREMRSILLHPLPRVRFTFQYSFFPSASSIVAQVQCWITDEWSTPSMSVMQ